MKWNIVTIALIIATCLSCLSVKRSCDYSFKVIQKEYGSVIEISSFNKLIFKSSDADNDVRGHTLDSVYNSYLRSMVYFDCAWLDSYCVLDMFYRKSNNCEIEHQEISEISDVGQFTSYLNNENYDLSKEKRFYIGKSKGRMLPIYTNIIILDDGSMQRIPDATTEYILDLKTMRIVQTIDPPESPNPEMK